MNEFAEETFETFFLSSLLIYTFDVQNPYIKILPVKESKSKEKSKSILET